MNKRFKPDFDHLLETAYIVEGHGCHGAAHGCCCRGCSECEENYKHEENYESEMEESGEPGLREIMDSLGKPSTNVPYGDDPEADSPEYNENNELSNISNVIGTVMNLPTKQELEAKAGKGIFRKGDPVINKAIDVREFAAGALNRELKKLEDSAKELAKGE